MGRRVASRERGVQRHRVVGGIDAEAPGQVHLVAVAGAEQVDDRFDACFELVAIEARVPTTARRLHAPAAALEPDSVCSAFEDRTARAVSVHGDLAAGVDRGEGPETREDGIRNRRCLERRARRGATRSSA